MDNNSLKKAFMGGYTKKSVHTFLDELADKYESDLAALSEEKGRILDRADSLEKELSDLKAELSDRDRDRDYVSSAIVSAEKEAAKILSDAAKEADEIKAQTLASLKEERDKITDLRMSLYQAMQTYKDKLDTIAKRTDSEN